MFFTQRECRGALIHLRHRATLMKFLAISGSLRAASINSSLLRVASRLAQDDLTIDLFAGLGRLPLFNPDLEAQLPAAVLELHRAVAASDALLIASPEYAHGVSGSMKNALDWLVSFEPFVGKHFAVINTSPRARHADAALRETLRTMSAAIVEEASISLPLLGANLDEAAIAADPRIAAALSGALRALRNAVESARPLDEPTFPVP